MTRPERTRPRRPLATVLLVAVLGAFAAPIATGDGHSAGAADGPQLTLIDQEFVVVADGPATFRFELDGALPERPELPEPPAPPEPDSEANDTEDPDGAPDRPDAGPEPETDRVDWVDVVVTAYEPLERRDQVMPVLAGVTGRSVSQIRIPLDTLIPDPHDATARVDLTIPTRVTPPGSDEPGDDGNGNGAHDADGDDGDDGDESAALLLDRAGLYPVTIDLVHEGRRLERHVTFVERLHTTTERALRVRPYHLAIVAAIDDPGPEPSALDLISARARLIEVVQLGEALDAPVNARIPPGVLAALDADDLTADRLPTALAGDELLAVPEVALDPSSAVAAGEFDAFVRELRRGEDLLATLAPSASSQRTTWVTTDDVSTAGATALRDLGVRLLVVPLADYHALDGSLPPAFTDPSSVYPVQLPGDGAMNVAVVDPVSRWIDPQRADGRTAAEAAVAALAELSATRIQLPDATRLGVLSTDRLAPPDADVLRHLEQMVAGHPGFEFRTLSFASGTTDVFDQGRGTRPVQLPTSAGVDLVARSQRLVAARADVARTATMLPDGDPRPAQWSRDLDRWLSTGFDDDDVFGRLAALDAELVAIPAAIVPPEPFTFTLTGNATEITLRLTNEGPTPLRVLIRSEASKLTFPDGDTVVVLPPGITNVEIPVRTLSNGTFTVTVALLTPDAGAPIGEPVVLTARVTALTGLGQVLTGGALLVLATWWLSHLRTRRRAEAALERSRGHPSRGTSDSVATP